MINLKVNNKLYVFVIILLLFVPNVKSNGGCIKIADDVFVQLSASPLVPIVNKQESFLISFADTKKELIKEEISGKIWITKNEETILTKNFTIKNGILDLKHIFKKDGLYEIFLEFNFNGKIYTPEDFLIEVKESNKNFGLNFIFLFVGIFVGALLTKLMQNKALKSSKKAK